MDNGQPRNTTVTQNKAREKKRADALRQNLLKRKQQTRARNSDGSAVKSSNSISSPPQEKK